MLSDKEHQTSFKKFIEPLQDAITSTPVKVIIYSFPWYLDHDNMGGILKHIYSPKFICVICRRMMEKNWEQDSG